MDKDILLAVFCDVVNEVFGEDVKYVRNRTRYMKLFILTMDRLGEKVGYDEIPIAYGWYKFGIFSFEAHDIFRDVQYVDPIAPCLAIPQEFENTRKIITQIIKNFMEKFKMAWNDFDKFIHEELPNDEIRLFYRAVKRVNNAFDLLTSDKITLSSFFDIGISRVDDLKNAINQLENSVKFEYLVEEREDAFYYYTDALMLFLDNYEDNNICKDILKEMKQIFKEEVLSIISPYPETLKGNEEMKELELKKYTEVVNNKIDSLYNRVDAIEEKYEGYFPTHKKLVDDIKKIKISDELNSKILEILHKWVGG